MSRKCLWMGVRWRSVCVCVHACQKRSAGLLCFSSPPRLSSFLPTAWRRAMNHNHARPHFELERPAQPQARQMHLMTGSASVHLQHGALTCHRRLACGLSTGVNRAGGSRVELSLAVWRKGQSKAFIYLFFFILRAHQATVWPYYQWLSWGMSATYDMKAVGMKESAPQTLFVHHNKLHQQWPKADQGKKMASLVTLCKSPKGVNILWLC